MPEAKLSEADLSHFTGSENWYRHGIVRDVLFTDGAKYVADEGGAYLRHVPKACILDAVKEAVTPEAAENLAKLKKDALAREAEQRLAGTGWLPEILRRPVASDQLDPVALAAE